MPAQVELAIWDTAGQERFHALGPIYYRDAQAALLVYDITDADSFTRVQTWVQELRQMVSHQASCKLMTLSALTCQLLSLHTCLYLQLNCNYSPRLQLGTYFCSCFPETCSMVCCLIFRASPFVWSLSVERLV